MALTFLDAESAVDTAGSMTIDVSAMTGFDNDCLIVAFVSAYNASSSGAVVGSVPTGFTQIGETLYNATLDTGTEWYYKESTGAETNLTFTSADDAILWILLFDLAGGSVASAHGQQTAGDDQDTDNTTSADIMTIAEHTDETRVFDSALFLYGLSIQYETGGGITWTTDPTDTTGTGEADKAGTFTGFYSGKSEVFYGSGATQQDLADEPATSTIAVGPGGGWSKVAFFGRVVIDIEAAVPNISPDAQYPYTRLRARSKALPYYVDTGILKGT